MELREQYQNILRDHLARRCTRNPKYTLRAFARDLGLDPARLSDILNSKKGISGEAAEEIGHKLGLSDEECLHLKDLAEASHARSAVSKAAALNRLREREESRPNHSSNRNLTLDSFQLVRDWYPFAILHLMKNKNYIDRPEWVAKRLGISQHQVVDAIDRLKRVGLVQELDGRNAPTPGFVFSPNGVASEAIRFHHEQILTKAITALHTQSLEKRDYQALMIPMKQDRVPEIKKSIRAFVEGLNREYSENELSDCVYQVGLQLFEITEPVLGDSQ